MVLQGDGSNYLDVGFEFIKALTLCYPVRLLGRFWHPLVRCLLSWSL